MATKQSREHLNPFKKKFISPNGNRKSTKVSGISPKFKANLKDLHKFPNKKDAGLKKKLYEMKKREKYHLGGNSSDPLNLNSLIDRDPTLNTPQASPHPIHGDSPIEICHPHDYKDPLNLKCYPNQDGKEGPTPKKKRKKKHKVCHNDIENNEGKTQNQNLEKVEPSEVKRKRKRKKHKKFKNNTEKKKKEDENKVQNEDGKVDENTIIDKKGKDESGISNVDEPPTKKARKLALSDESGKKVETVVDVEEKLDSKLKVKDSGSSVPPASCTGQKKANFRPKNTGDNKSHKVFIYGNYNRYYNYRNPNCTEDVRLKSLRKEWFVDKDVLDIGCNVGNITIAVAQQFEPRIIIGNDIDNHLVKIAKSNVQALARQTMSSKSITGGQFPLSFAVTNGPIAAPILLNNGEGNLQFPKNIIFKQENYVPPNEKSLSNQRPMFDTILCLSVTKWVHLNWGDQGLKLMFKKIFRSLRPGGRLILEPQPFGSYSRRKKLSNKIKANYESILFRPEQFIDYLLSEEVGFLAYEVLGEPQYGAPGFRRPMYLFTKASSNFTK